MARSHLRVDSSLDVLSCVKSVENHEPIDFAAAIVHGCHSRILLVTCYLTHSQGASALNLTKLARLGALIHTLHLPYVIVGDFHMTPAQLVVTQWIVQNCGHIVTPQETVSTCSSGGRMIDFAVIFPALTRNVELTLDLDAPFAPHSSICLKLHLSISHITLTSQLRPRPMPWEAEGGVKPVVASGIWSGLESTNPIECREQGPCPVLKASVVFRTFGAESSLLQPKIRTWLQRLSAYWRLRSDMRSPLDRSTARPPHWLEATRCGRPRFREISITGRHSWRDAVTSDSLGEMVAHSFSTVGGLRRCL